MFLSTYTRSQDQRTYVIGEERTINNSALVLNMFTTCEC